MNMPTIDLSVCGLTADEMKIAEGIVVSRGANKGRLLSSKPNKEEIYEKDGRRYRRNVKGETAYVWRMVAFDLCSFHPHCCIPVTADWDVGDLNTSNDERRARVKVLDAIVDKITKAQPNHKRGGLNRWSQALTGSMLPGTQEVLPGLYAAV